MTQPPPTGSAIAPTEIAEAIRSAVDAGFPATVADLARLVRAITDGATLAWLADRDDAAAERMLDLAADALAAFAVSALTGTEESR